MLDRKSKIPLHVQLRDRLQREITNGAYRPGETFPTEREISQKYHVSRTTIREAVVDLARMGYVVRQQGRGTFVARSNDTFDATQLSSFTEDMSKRGLAAGAQLLGLDLQIPDRACREHFGGGVEAVWRIYRLRLADEEPIALQTSFVPATRFKFSEEELATGSLYRLLAERYGISVTSADEIISATTADLEQADLLGIEPSSALLCVDRHTYSHVGEPIEYVRILYRANRYKFFVHQVRGD